MVAHITTKHSITCIHDEEFHLTMESTFSAKCPEHEAKEVSFLLKDSHSKV